MCSGFLQPNPSSLSFLVSRTGLVLTLWCCRGLNEKLQEAIGTVPGSQKTCLVSDALTPAVEMATITTGQKERNSWGSELRIQSSMINFPKGLPR